MISNSLRIHTVKYKNLILFATKCHKSKYSPLFIPLSAVHLELDMGVAEFKSARRWKKNLTRRRAEVQVSNHHHVPYEERLRRIAMA